MRVAWLLLCSGGVCAAMLVWGVRGDGPWVLGVAAAGAAQLGLAMWLWQRQQRRVRP